MSATSDGGIGTLNEGPLHAAIKAWYQRPGDLSEAALENYTVDLIRGELLIEIQTTNFSAMKTKLALLLPEHRVRIVYPVAAEKWIVKDPGEQQEPQRRKSPKRGSYADLFTELVRFPALIKDPNLEIEVLLTHQEEHRRQEANRAWRRRGWVIQERRLLKIVESRLFQSPVDLQDLLPRTLPNPFATPELAEALGASRVLAGRMAYCLREVGALEVVGKRRNAFLYALPAGHSLAGDPQP